MTIINQTNSVTKLTHYVKHRINFCIFLGNKIFGKNETTFTNSGNLQSDCKSAASLANHQSYHTERRL